MGVAASTCIKQKNPTPQLDFSVPVILKRKLIGRKPHKQNLLVPPLSQLGESEESLDQLDLILQEANITCSIHKTATFCSNNRQSIKEKLDMSLNLMTPSSFQTQINPNLSFQETQKSNHKQPEAQHNVHHETKESQFKIKAEKQNGKRELYAKSLSSNSRARKMQNQNEESSQSLKRDSETNTKKSILKNKNQIIANQLKRGISLRQQQQQNDDTQSQKTSKSQQKKVQFDPKIFRPKNTHFFQ